MAMTIDQTCAYMTVKAAPLLQNEQVCDFLEKMNQEEITQTNREEQPLKTQLGELDKAYSWTVIIKDGVYAALGFGSVISTAKYTYDHSSYAKDVDEGWTHHDARAAGWKENLSSEEKKACIETAKQTSKQNYLTREQERIADADDRTRTWFLASAFVSGCVAVACDLAVYRVEKSKLLTHYTSSINDSRHLRLQHRIRQIGEQGCVA